MSTRSLEHILNVEDARLAAKSRLPHGLFEYVDRGAEDETSIISNRAQLDAIRLSPLALVDVTERSVSANILGRTRPLPFAIAPTAVAGLVWFDGEIELAKAAASAGIPFCVSTQSITAIERIAAASDAELWFQLYVWRNRQRMFALVDRAWAAGAQTLVLTVDNPVTPNREYNRRNGFGIPLRVSARAGLGVLLHPRWAFTVMLRALITSGIAPEFRTRLGRISVSDELAFATDVTWDDVHELRRRWPGKLVLKGIFRPDDALRARSCGVDAIVVSNHGGRNLDSAPGPVEVLPAIADAVSDSIEVLADSGVRRGADIARLMSLGATGVLVGRATLYGLACGGVHGARRVIDILGHELITTMGFIGATSLEQLKGRSFLHQRLASPVTAADPHETGEIDHG